MKTEAKKWYVGTDTQGVGEIIEAAEYPKMIFEGGKYGTMTGGYASKDELIEKAKVHSLPCVECGGVITLNYFKPTPDILISKCVCFSCNHWLEVLDEKDHPRRVFVKGVAYWRKDYRDIPNRDKHVLGFSGSEFRIKMHSGEEHLTNDLWCSGDIPTRFKERLPDNAVFLPLKAS
jgi:hypothetical protein